MFIPINTVEGNLGLSVIRTKKGYSVAIVETCDNRLSSVPSHCYYNIQESDNDECVVCTTDYKIITGSKHENADICDDPNCCQAWISKDNRFARWENENKEANWQKIVLAVDSTARKLYYL